MQIEVVIEVPQGSRNKYGMDHATGGIRLDRMLFTSTRYPADYGIFIPGTIAEDGDPLDAMQPAPTTTAAWPTAAATPAAELRGDTALGYLAAHPSGSCLQPFHALR